VESQIKSPLSISVSSLPGMPPSNPQPRSPLAISVSSPPCSSALVAVSSQLSQPTIDLISQTEKSKKLASMNKSFVSGSNYHPVT
jgi:hypothetical protein